MHTFMGALALIAVSTVLAEQQHQQPLGHHKPPPGGRDPFTDEFSALAKSVMDEWHAAGMSLAVVDGESVFTKVCIIPSPQSSSAPRKSRLNLSGFRIRKISRYPRNARYTLLRRINYKGTNRRRPVAFHRYERFRRPNLWLEHHHLILDPR
jgi:hypothetical protein